MPAPSLVRVPEPVAIGSLTVMLPAPPSVRLYVPAIALPAETSNVSVPESELIRVALCSVIAPENVLLFSTFRSAPPLETPVPFRYSGSAAVVIVPTSSSAVPGVLDTTYVPAPVLPSALLCVSRTTPCVMENVPLNVLLPANVSEPGPTFVQFAEFWTTPLTVAVLPGATQTCGPWVEPSSIVRLAFSVKTLVKPSVPELQMLIFSPAPPGTAPAAWSCPKTSMPAVTCATPEFELMPVSTSVPASTFCQFEVPTMLPPYVTEFPLVTPIFGVGTLPSMMPRLVFITKEPENCRVPLDQTLKWLVHGDVGAAPKQRSAEPCSTPFSACEPPL